MIDNLTGLYFTKHNENTFEIKVRENDDKYYLFINGKFIKAYKYKMSLYNYVRINYDTILLF